MKVGIIDFGFEDLDHALVDDIDGAYCIDLLDQTFVSHDVEDCRKASNFALPKSHGAMNVEALHAITPDAEVYIANMQRGSAFPQIVDWMVNENEVDIMPNEAVHRVTDGDLFNLNTLPAAQNRGDDIRVGKVGGVHAELGGPNARAAAATRGLHIHKQRGRSCVRAAQGRLHYVLGRRRRRAGVEATDKRQIHRDKQRRRAHLRGDGAVICWGSIEVQ